MEHPTLGSPFLQREGGQGLGCELSPRAGIKRADICERRVSGRQGASQNNKATRSGLRARRRPRIARSEFLVSWSRVGSRLLFFHDAIIRGGRRRGRTRHRRRSRHGLDHRRRSGHYHRLGLNDPLRSCFYRLVIRACRDEPTNCDCSGNNCKPYVSHILRASRSAEFSNLRFPRSRTD